MSFIRRRFCRARCPPPTTNEPMEHSSCWNCEAMSYDKSTILAFLKGDSMAKCLDCGQDVQPAKDAFYCKFTRDEAAFKRELPSLTCPPLEGRIIANNMPIVDFIRLCYDPVNIDDFWQRVMPDVAGVYSVTLYDFLDSASPACELLVYAVATSPTSRVEANKLEATAACISLRALRNLRYNREVIANGPLKSKWERAIQKLKTQHHGIRDRLQPTSDAINDWLDHVLVEVEED